MVDVRRVAFVLAIFGLAVALIGVSPLVVYAGYLLPGRVLTLVVWLLAVFGAAVNGFFLLDHLGDRWQVRHSGAMFVCFLGAPVAVMFYAFGLGMVLETRSLIHHGDRIDAVVVAEHEVYTSSDSPPGYVYTIRRTDGTTIPGELGNNGGQLDIGQRVSVVVDPENHSLPVLDPSSELVKYEWTTGVGAVATVGLVAVLAWSGPRPPGLARPRPADTESVVVPRTAARRWQ
jgi:hypothetical protein